MERFIAALVGIGPYDNILLGKNWSENVYFCHKGNPLISMRYTRFMLTFVYILEMAILGKPAT